MKNKRRNHKEDKCEGFNNLSMDEKVYQLRRQVMNIIYEARELLDFTMPRIQIRITEAASAKHRETLGMASMGECEIWIPATTIDDGEKILRHVVYHELCHAIWGIDHDKNCKLMTAFVEKPCTKNECHKIFKSYAKQYKKTA